MLFARLGGANRDVLAQVPTAVGRFIQIGLVLLCAASIAALSMASALIMGLNMSPPFAIILGIAWGLIFFNLNRLLIQNLRLNTGHPWRTIATVSARGAISSLLSLVVSTPLVLLVFNSDIQAQLALNRAQPAGRVHVIGSGLLARIQALDELSGSSSAAFFAHWVVAALFFIIEILPVLVPLMTMIGPPTLYDRVSELMDETAFDAAMSRRNAERRRIELASKKDLAIQENMYAREVQLGIRANAHVSDEMQKFLDAALAAWRNQVSETSRKAEGGSRIGQETDQDSSTSP